MKAWLYYRLSRDEDEEMNSLYNQRQILVDYAEQQGYEIVGESSDDNVSGMTFDRKGLAKLENAVDEGKVAPKWRRYTKIWIILRNLGPWPVSCQ